MGITMEQLQSTLDRYFKRYEARQTQGAVGVENMTTPLSSRRYAAGGAATWQAIDTDAMEVLVLAGDPEQQLGVQPAYIRFGQDGPSSSTAVDADALPVTPGTKVRVPQGVRKLWFLAPTSDAAWRLVFVRVPNFSIDYGPYGAKLAEQVLQTDVVTMSTSDPALVTDGVAVPSRATRAFVHFAVLDTGVYSRVAASFDAELWWMPESSAPQLWAHNAADDFTAAQLGQVGVDHDCEVMQVGALSRFAIVSTATPASGDYVAIVTWMG